MVKGWDYARDAKVFPRYLKILSHQASCFLKKDAINKKKFHEFFFRKQTRLQSPNY